uniref:Uncharacterized protein n=1 Tax=Cucumis melo TaxID=3656 RepID=A0A9I9E720_CUCME
MRVREGGFQNLSSSSAGGTTMKDESAEDGTTEDGATEDGTNQLSIQKHIVNHYVKLLGVEPNSRLAMYIVRNSDLPTLYLAFRELKEFPMALPTTSKIPLPTWFLSCPTPNVTSCVISHTQGSLPPLHGVTLLKSSCYTANPNSTHQGLTVFPTTRKA